MIEKVTLKQFIGFSSFQLTDTAPINLIIGSNDSGKTGLLKMLYAVSKSYQDFLSSKVLPKPLFKQVLADKLINTFQPRQKGLGELVKRGQTEKLESTIAFKGAEKQVVKFSFGESTTKTIKDCTENEYVDPFLEGFSTVFIPAKEVLTAFEAIALTREQYDMPGFDDTYYDLIKALRVPTVQGNVIAGLREVNELLEHLFEGIIQQGSREMPFVFKKGNSVYSMPLTAEGIKKVGILTTLIRNRVLGRHTVLFMDEPETALHPKAVRSLAEMIYKMSECGIQVFLTSHNYFMIKQLSIIAKREKKRVNCISLVKERDKEVEYSVSNLQDGLPENPIISEALEMFKEEVKTDLIL